MIYKDKTAHEYLKPSSIQEEHSSTNRELPLMDPSKVIQEDVPVPKTYSNIEPVDVFPDQTATIEAFFKKNQKLDDQVTDSAAVRELQQALIDLKQLSPKDIEQLGKYDDATKKAVAAYRKSRAGKSKVVNTSGNFDKSDKTLVEDHFRDREAYIEAATSYDKSKSKEGTRPLDETDKAAIGKVYKEEKEESSTTDKAAKGTLKGKEKDIRELFFKTYKVNLYTAYNLKYVSQVKQREEGEKAEKAAPTKDNPFLFSKSSIEDIANQAKKAVDSLYQNMASASPKFKFGDNLLDQWEMQQKKHPTVVGKKGNITKSASKDAAYFFENALRPQIDKAENIEHQKQKYVKIHGISMERINAIQQRAIEDVLKDKQLVEFIIKTEQGVSGLVDEGKQYLQRFKSTEKDPTKKLEEDRKKRWKIFYTSIHEYIHLLQHKDYIQWLNKHKDPKRRILAEGVAEFFTLNVYAKFPPSALKGAYQEAIEGRKPATEPVPTYEEAGKRVYPEHKKAEELVRQVGVHNVQAAFFQGKTELLDENYEKD